jgi:hypothetical protein
LSHQIPAKDLLWSMVLGTILRQLAFLAIEALVGSKARRNLNVSRTFGDDALGYFTERLDPAPTRAALSAVLHRAKPNKAFQDCRFVRLALDGTTVGRRRKKGCPLCRSYRNIAITWSRRRWWAATSSCPRTSNPTGRATVNTQPGSAYCVMCAQAWGLASLITL